MTFQGTFIEHDIDDEVRAWLDMEIEEQKARYASIVDEMDAMDEERARWYEEFFIRLQKYGFNVDGDMKVKIKPEELPVKPDRPHKVVY